MESETAGVNGELDWSAVWAATASGLERHWHAGRGHLLTEDTLRLCLIEALQACDIDASRMATEVLSPNLRNGKLDLTIDGPSGTVVELKYPRGSRTGFSPDTMTMGELLRDFCRVAVVDAKDRWVAQVIDNRLARYLASAALRYGLDWSTDVGERMVLVRSTLEGLPRTAVTALGETPWRLPLSATCRARLGIVDGLTLMAYQIDSPDTIAPSALRTLATLGQRQTQAGRDAPEDGARKAILDAVDQLQATSRRDTVTVAEVLAHLRARGTRYADSTIRTMMTSHMCADSQGRGVASYSDLERAGRGEYRRRDSSPR